MALHRRSWAAELTVLFSVLSGCTDRDTPAVAPPGGVGATPSRVPAGSIVATIHPAPSGRQVVLPDGRAGWFVEVVEPQDNADAPASGVERAPRRRAGHETVLANLAARGVTLTPNHRFDRLWNGLAVHVTEDVVAKIAATEGVKAIFPILVIDREEPLFGSTSGGSSTPDLASAVSMTGADVVHSSLGLTGAGIRVGVIDSGIDYQHPDLGGCFGPSCRVIAGYDFVGDAYDAGSASKSIPSPDADPDDCGGHGTHVAGIVGASGVINGVAPGVNFGAYRVFGCSGSTSSDLMLAAMERAYSDGMRVVNISIGSAGEWPEYPTAVGASNLVAEGIVVVASIGNSGNLTFSSGAPGTGAEVIGVGSVDNVMTTTAAFNVSPGNAKYGYNVASGAPTPPSTGTVPLVRTGTTTTPNDGCNALAAGSLTGQIALIRRGTCSFYVKSINAQNAGAVGVVLYNNTTGALSPTVAGTPALTIPVVAITASDGLAINATLDGGPASLSWGNLTAAVASTTGGQISSFSSAGPTVELGFKPDLAAPGGTIWSTYPLELGGYTSLSGTSMASPHVAGAAALMLQANSTLSAADIKGRLQNTAVPAAWSGNPTGTTRETVHRQGAGLIQIDDAIQSAITVHPSAIALGEVTAPVQHSVTLSNTSSAPVTYDVTVVDAEGYSGSLYTPVATATSSVFSFNNTTLLVPAGGSTQLDFTLTADAAAPNGTMFGAFVVLTPQGGGQILRVPVMGYKGDYQAATTLGPADKSYPFAGRLSNGSYVKLNAGESLPIGTGPAVLAHFEMGAQKFQVEVFDATGTKSYGFAVNRDHVQRNSASSGPNAFSAFTWDGTLLVDKGTSKVVPGDYVMRIRALKPLGDENNPAHWESFTSSVFTLTEP